MASLDAIGVAVTAAAAVKIIALTGADAGRIAPRSALRRGRPSRTCAARATRTQQQAVINNASSSSKRRSRSGAATAAAAYDRYRARPAAILRAAAAHARPLLSRTRLRVRGAMGRCLPTHARANKVRRGEEIELNFFYHHFLRVMRYPVVMPSRRIEFYAQRCRDDGAKGFMDCARLLRSRHGLCDLQRRRDLAPQLGRWARRAPQASARKIWRVRGRGG